MKKQEITQASQRQSALVLLIASFPAALFTSIILGVLSIYVFFGMIGLSVIVFISSFDPKLPKQ